MKNILESFKKNITDIGFVLTVLVLVYAAVKWVIPAFNKIVDKAKGGGTAILAALGICAALFAPLVADAADIRHKGNSLVLRVGQSRDSQTNALTVWDFTGTNRMGINTNGNLFHNDSISNRVGQSITVTQMNGTVKLRFVNGFLVSTN